MSRKRFNEFDDEDIGEICENGTVLGIEGREDGHLIINIAVPGQCFHFEVIGLSRSFRVEQEDVEYAKAARQRRDRIK